MAVTRRAPVSENVSDSRIVVSVALIVALAAIIGCLMWVKRRIRNDTPVATPLVPLPSQGVQPRKGIESYLLESIPVITYRASLESNEQEETSMPGESTCGGAGDKSAKGASTMQTEVDAGGLLDNTLYVSTQNINTPLKEDTAQIMEPKGSRQDSKTCSICTEDFVEGRNVRILPCRHIYHRRCIDPWLLDFAGTCPLWYVTLARIN
jgi:Ring finger domain